MSFYRFRQNNSGGSFEYDVKKGIGINVIVEANSADVANARAREIGLYFNGVEDGADCECCGDRWYPCLQSEGSQMPTVYGDILGTGLARNESGFVHYLDSRIVAFGNPD